MTGNTGYRCPFCGKISKTYYAFKTHLLYNHLEEIYGVVAEGRKSPGKVVCRKWDNDCINALAYFVLSGAIARARRKNGKKLYAIIKTCFEVKLPSK